MSNTIKIIRGDTATIAVTFKDANGAAINLTGSTVFLTVKQNPDSDATDTSAIIKKSNTSHTNPTGGITTFVISPTESNVEAGNYVYDLQIKTSGGAISSTLPDDFTVVADVTRRTA